MFQSTSKLLFTPQFKPSPPPNLTKEKLGVWMGWHCKGDREVAREAAAKGSHIDLVKIFLAQRRRAKLEDTEIWFEKEVFIWVDELLERKQIFRASHLLQNIGLVATKELSKIFYKTTKNDLREYIGNHIKKLNELDEHLIHLWHFLDVILKNNLLIAKYNLREDSIECLDQQSDFLKAEIAAKLFLRTFDAELTIFLNSDILWNQLLMYNDIKLLIIWINLKFNENYSTDNDSVPESVINTFKKFLITNEMINAVDGNLTSENTRNLILNEFSKFGIFTNTDSKNFLNIIKRINNSDSILNIYITINKSSSNLNFKYFLKLLINYCLENRFYNVLNTCVKDFELPEDIVDINLKLIQSFRNLISSNFDENVLCENIFMVANFLCDDLVSYFQDNPMIFLALILFTKDARLSQIVDKKSFHISNTDLSPAIPNILEKFVVVKNLLVKQNSPIVNQLTFYDLLKIHVKIDVDKLFSFQFDNTEIIPHFNSSVIVDNYGYSKSVNYLFFVKQSRPSIACKLFIIDQFRKNKYIKEEDVKIAVKKTYTISILNYYNTEITSSCIAFLEMIGTSSELLRVCIDSANILLNANQDPIQIKTLFLNLEKESDKIQLLLESTILTNIYDNLFCDGKQLTDALKLYDVVVKFSILTNIKLPELFLKHCANNNLWLPFLIFAQIKNYPIEQIKLLLQSMKNPNLLEHICHSVIHDIQVDEQNVLMKERDSRKYFLSRIGVRKSIDTLSSQNTDSVYSSITSQSSFGSGGSSIGSDFLEIDISNTKATLVQTLIRCHNSTDPPKALLQACQLYRNPLLAIFATSYEPDSIVTNWLTWLAVSSELCHTFTNFEAISVCAKSVTILLDNCMKRQFPQALLQSFQIFLPTNPLLPFIQFLNSCIMQNYDMKLLQEHLNLYQTLLNKARRNSVLTDTDHEMTYLKSKTWIESTALLLLSSAIEYNCDSFYGKIIFLETLCKLAFQTYFSIDCPNLQNILKILNLLHDCKYEIYFDITEAFQQKHNRKAVIDSINLLLDHECYDTALQIAEIENLPLDLILTKEWQFKFETRDKHDTNFWLNCNEVMRSNNITADCVIEFYLDNIDKLISAYEKFQLLKLSYEWSSRFELSNTADLEIKMWLAYVRLEEKYRDPIELRDKQQTYVLYKEMLDEIKKVNNFGEIPIDCKAGLDNLLKTTLNEGNFWLALKFEKLFGCKSGDLDILKLCYSLAEGITLPYQLNTEQRLLLAKGANFRRLSNRRTFLSARLSSFSSTSHSPANLSFNQTNDGVDAPLQDTLAVIQSLYEKLTTGIELGSKIFMFYRISINIEIPYQVIVSNIDHMKMLKDSLEDDCMNKLEVVHDFINVYKWSKDQIADFICEEIVNAASFYIKSRNDNFIMWDVNIDKEFNLILQLLQDNCSILGYKLYTYASALYKLQALSTDVKISELNLVTLLLIAAHDCFTADCNMEGISTILKKCQKLISHLLTLRSWKLIVKLLTGVARYTEMNYVFQILKENDQFEFLLQKGSRKDNGLKIALLEYLKKYCPDNKELYKLVALHFALFSEVAQLWERESQSLIRNLITISKMEMQNNKMNVDDEPFVLFYNTESTKLCLNKAIEFYTHATEFHLQGEKLAKAMNSAKQAELIALQMSLLKGLSNNGTAFCILNLTNNQIVTLVTNHLSFDQTYILIQAYSCNADWAAILYQQCICKNNNSYMDDFLQHFSLTESLAHDITRKFLNANINTPNEITSMKNIINLLPSVHTKYRLASELGFTDLVEDLLGGEQLAYLKDTVWKRGYKN